MIPNQVFRLWVKNDDPFPSIVPAIAGAENVVITRANCELPDDHARMLFDTGDSKLNDYLKLWYLWMYGGVFVDCDIIQLKRLDPLLGDRFFVGRQGPEDADNPVLRMVCTAVIGSEAEHPILGACMEQMRGKPLSAGLHEYSMDVLDAQVLAHCDSASIYPREFFYPFSWLEEPPERFGDDTYLAHLWAGSWVNQDFCRCFDKVAHIMHMGRTA